MIKFRLYMAFALFVLASCTHYEDKSGGRIVIGGSSLDNFYMVDRGVYRSDQPARGDFALLEEYGIREVLNMRNYHSDTRPARGTDLTLHHLRTRAGRISVAELTEAMRIINDRRGPVVIHCWHGSDRTGAVVAAYRMVFQDVSVEDAVAEMTGGGYGFHEIYGNIIDTLRVVDADRIRRELNME